MRWEQGQESKPERRRTGRYGGNVSGTGGVSEYEAMLHTTGAHELARTSWRVVLGLL